ncbi:MAG: PC4/YdbC family ssDNA-binding protein [Gammaproteobacteria bacterium]
MEGRWHVHVRIYAGSGSEKRPTRKGITLKRDQIGPLMIALRKALHGTD